MTMMITLLEAEMLEIEQLTCERERREILHPRTGFAIFSTPTFCDLKILERLSEATSDRSKLLLPRT